ncbi:YlbF family regulator, partial [Staphylococcus pseudintermedius]
FKHCEPALQQLFDMLVTMIATSVSEHVKIDAGTLLFAAVSTGW